MRQARRISLESRPHTAAATTIVAQSSSILRAHGPGPEPFVRPGSAAKRRKNGGRPAMRVSRAGAWNASSARFVRLRVLCGCAFCAAVGSRCRGRLKEWRQAPPVPEELAASASLKPPPSRSTGCRSFTRRPQLHPCAVSPTFLAAHTQPATTPKGPPSLLPGSRELHLIKNGGSRPWP